MTAKRESDLLTTSMITDRIGRRKVLLPIIHKSYNFPKTTNTLRTNVQKRQCLGKKIPQLWKFPNFFRVRGYCYGYCNQFCDRWI